MHRAMSNDAPHRSELDPVDIQRLLVWYFEMLDPSRPHIRPRSWDAALPAAVASAGL
jgi:hypothetical protein